MCYNEINVKVGLKPFARKWNNYYWVWDVKKVDLLLDSLFLFYY